MTEPLVLGAPIPDIRCPFCGKTLRQIIHRSASLTAYVPKYEACECEGAKAQAEQDRRVAESRERELKTREHQKTVDRILSRSGIRGRYLTKTLGSYRVNAYNQTALKSAFKYVLKFPDFLKTGQGLFFTGACGVGKTHLATGIALDLIEKEYRVICKSSVTLLADIRASYGDAAEWSEYELLRDYLRADLLVIDDLGKELITDWSLSMLYTILNMRYEDRKPVVITTNYDDAGLIDRLARKGDRVTAEAMVSRLHEICFGVEVGGEDYRSK